MKISWGVIIISVFILFAGLISFLVGVSMTSNSDLVADNYYENELKYQDKIEEINRTNSLAGNLKIETLNNSIRISFPEAIANEKITGKIKFYRAMEKKKDFEVDIIKDQNNSQVIPVTLLDKGNWKLQISWEMKGSKYYKESDIFIK